MIEHETYFCKILEITILSVRIIVSSCSARLLSSRLNFYSEYASVLNINTDNSNIPQYFAHEQAGIILTFPISMNLYVI